jgi:hypothetical protein
MKKLFTGIVCAILLGLAGCKVSLPPIESGFYGDGWITQDSSNKTVLTPLQITALSEWFKPLQTGWAYKVTDNPAGKIICVNHRNGDVTWVNLLGHELWMKNHVKTLTSRERDSLLEILRLGFSPPRQPADAIPR